MPESPFVIVVAGQVFPLTQSTPEAAVWLECSEELLQRERGTGRLPCEPLAVGRRLRWRTTDLCRATGVPFEVVAGADVAASQTGEHLQASVVDLASHQPSGEAAS